jgi:hypothetical protein
MKRKSTNLVIQSIGNAAAAELFSTTLKEKKMLSFVEFKLEAAIETIPSAKSF